MVEAVADLLGIVSSLQLLLQDLNEPEVLVDLALQFDAR